MQRLKDKQAENTHYGVNQYGKSRADLIIGIHEYHEECSEKCQRKLGYKDADTESASYQREAKGCEYTEDRVIDHDMVKLREYPLMKRTGLLEVIDSRE